LTPCSRRTRQVPVPTLSPRSWARRSSGGRASGGGSVGNVERELERLLGTEAMRHDLEAYSRDSTEMQGLRGTPDAVVAPASTDDVQRLVRWCFRRGVVLIPRGGGTGFAGGAVPVRGGVVCSLERMNRIAKVEAGLWRAVV